MYATQHNTTQSNWVSKIIAIMVDKYHGVICKNLGLENKTKEGLKVFLDSMFAMQDKNMTNVIKRIDIKCNFYNSGKGSLPINQVLEMLAEGFASVRLPNEYLSLDLDDSYLMIILLERGEYVRKLTELDNLIGKAPAASLFSAATSSSSSSAATNGR